MKTAVQCNTKHTKFENEYENHRDAIGSIKLGNLLLHACDQSCLDRVGKQVIPDMQPFPICSLVMASVEVESAVRFSDNSDFTVVYSRVSSSN